MPSVQNTIQLSPNASGWVFSEGSIQISFFLFLSFFFSFLLLSFPLILPHPELPLISLHLNLDVPKEGGEGEHLCNAHCLTWNFHGCSSLETVHIFNLFHSYSFSPSPTMLFSLIKSLFTQARIKETPKNIQVNLLSCFVLIPYSLTEQKFPFLFLLPSDSLRV